MTQRLKMPGSVRDADLIFAPAGLEARKVYALNLYYERRIPQILLSVSRFELRKLPKVNIPVPIDLVKIAAAIPPPERHFFVWFNDEGVHNERISVGRFGTFSEIEALTRWLRKRDEIRSILIVSSAYHLRRVRMCCQALMPAGIRADFIAVPAENPQMQGAPRSLGVAYIKRVPQEIFKIVVYWVLLRLRFANAR